MTPSDLQSPPSVEGGPPSAGPDPSQQPDVSQAHYRSSDEECYHCAHFQGPSTCTLGVNGGQVESGSGCDLFAIKGGGDGDGDEQQGGATPMPGQGAPPQGAPQQ